ncbi:acetamidase/formamidase family protein [Actinomadura madurae]|uniref:acetamidase/formamidase family protein n=1 Tax=Actinomadura madurae TaxID=1993 RepID=UPI00202725D7|nr:acetamidase/formamidase family protein [Actinomadura madurae]MCP9954354.1 acetamidase/formamidase family protein [Actinomadura madurae]MCP9983587.1 acetamidase/formamidase family protein [Actinomadura madurae]MCQ0004845.1 acetamidase/formamidase family protein [Actinomadura madurae]URM99849.1 acetamidase/formamidase family protein [Actinomadura madurae]
MPSPAMFDLHDPGSRDVPGHDHWHPDLPGVAEVITGGSVRMECPGRGPGGGVLLCGPLVVVGAEPGDVIVVDVLGVGRAGCAHDTGGHPGIIGCAPSDPVALPAGARGRDVGGCRIAPPSAGSRVLLPVRVRGAKLSAGDLHFPARGGDGCDGAAAPGWIDLRVNLTRRGVERFRVTGPMLMPDPSPRVA